MYPPGSGAPTTNAPSSPDEPTSTVRPSADTSDTTTPGNGMPFDLTTPVTEQACADCASGSAVHTRMLTSAAATKTRPGTMLSAYRTCEAADLTKRWQRSRVLPQ